MGEGGWGWGGREEGSGVREEGWGGREEEWELGWGVGGGGEVRGGVGGQRWGGEGGQRWGGEGRQLYIPAVPPARSYPPPFFKSIESQ